MMYSQKSAGMSGHMFMGPPVVLDARPRSKARLSFMAYFSRHITACESAGRNGSAANYRQAYRMLARYLKGKELSFGQFNANWLAQYEQWLIGRGVGPNTVVFHIRYLRAVYNQAIETGYSPATHNNPFRRRVIRQVVTRKRALPRTKLKQIYNANLTDLHPKYALARDMFMFSFYTRGMSFVDMIFLKKSDICNDILTYKRKKTGQTLSVQIEPQLQTIIDRYNNDSPYILPVLAKNDSYKGYRQQQRELNKFIRKVGILLELTEPLTFYVARHSWATLARDCGTPLSIISAGMGHTSERTTRVYLTQLDHHVIDKANRKVINLK